MNFVFIGIWLLMIGAAACGDIIRDCNGRFQACFLVSILVFVRLHLLNFGVHLGLNLSISLGISHLSIEVDSMAAVNMCLNDDVTWHSARALVLAIREGCMKLNSWDLYHEFGEANTCGTAWPLMGIA
ncbi:hypothetical protein PIB30_079713 [Stylosanthes scabra]|uniref:RNase H type-1 domain-containing protein n=1 Tax=Stylosanthes scabra TaxID=79078 RepID=A0ABU6XP83_9FABA|nr:hypothetical protein [Stylosanthes scabra]